MIGDPAPFTVMVWVLVPVHVVEAVSVSFNEAEATSFHTMVTVLPL